MLHQNICFQSIIVSNKLEIQLYFETKFNKRNKNTLTEFFRMIWYAIDVLSSLLLHFTLSYPISSFILLNLTDLQLLSKQTKIILWYHTNQLNHYQSFTSLVFLLLLCDRCCVVLCDRCCVWLIDRLIDCDWLTDVGLLKI